MIKIYFSLFLLIASASHAKAQNILNEIRKDVPGQGHVTINQGSDIESLIVEPKAPQNVEQPANVAKKPVENSPKAEHQDNATAQQPIVPPAPKPGITDVEDTVNDSKKIMRRSYKTTGYRIQVYSGGNKRSDREKCENIAKRLKASIPGMPVYVHFYSPSWKCRAGNFTSLEEAQHILQQVKALGYSQACIIKGTINVAY